MATTHDDVKRSIESWGIQSEMTCKQKGARTELTYKGVSRVFPHWLALQKVNQIGADIGYVQHDL